MKKIGIFILSMLLLTHILSVSATITGTQVEQETLGNKTLTVLGIIPINGDAIRLTVSFTYTNTKTYTNGLMFIPDILNSDGKSVLMYEAELGKFGSTVKPYTANTPEDIEILELYVITTKVDVPNTDYDNPSIGDKLKLEITVYELNTQGNIIASPIVEKLTPSYEFTLSGGEPKVWGIPRLYLVIAGVVIFVVVVGGSILYYLRRKTITNMGIFSNQQVNVKFNNKKMRGKEKCKK